MAKGSSRRADPVAPLLAPFRRTVGAGHSTALPILPLRAEWLDSITDEALATELRRFAERALPVCFHAAVFTKQSRFLRHALAHLIRGHDPLPERLARCITPGE